MATQPANVQLGSFLRSGTQGVFSQIPPAQVLSGLKARLARPGSVNQGSTSLCGPATLMFAVIRHKPDDYVQYVLDLYRTGRGKLGRLEVEPGDDCKNYRPPRGLIDPVDWIALASLRDSENDFFDYDEVTDEVAGVTMPGDLEEWFKKAGYATTSNNTNVFLNKDLGDLLSAGHKYLSGANVFLFVNAQVLFTSTMKQSSTFPDHWITLTSPLNLSANRLNMTVFTWGDDSRRVPRRGPIDVAHFLDNFYGFVTAR